MKTSTKPFSQPVIHRGNNHVCKMCGAAEGENWQTAHGRRIRLTTGYLVPRNNGGRVERSNIRILCNECDEGLKGIEFIPRPSAQVLIEQMERASSSIKREVVAILLQKGEVLGYTCQMCGVAAGDPDPLSSGRTVRLTMGHIIDKSKCGKDTLENLRAVCTNFNEGLQNAALPKPDRIHLLAQVRRATIDDQEAVLSWLLSKFGLIAKKKR